MQYKRFVTGSFQENAFILWDQDLQTVIIDPGDDAAIIINFIESNQLLPQAILNTHAHVDHVQAVAPLQEQYDLPFHLHADDQNLIDHLPDYCRLFGIPICSQPQVNQNLQDNQNLVFGQLQIQVLGTPGHSLGGVCFLIEDHLFVGDTLFAGSIGRTDLPGGSYTQIIQSIKERILILPDGTKVHPGHGPDTTVGTERAQNPFLQ